ncbi:MAG TPA: hypothetical protein VGZ22_10520, partial [Isosphaeraceae bacterium]|nr:hypothetical protein [Isosphaeraceae bacterium]
PAIALSHYIARGRPLDWSRAAAWSARVLKELMARPWEPGSFWNVNLPHPEPGATDPQLVDCPLDPSALPLEFAVDGELYRYKGDYQSRARRPGADIAVCFGGQIAVTRIRLYPPEDALVTVIPPAS